MIKKLLLAGLLLLSLIGLPLTIVLSNQEQDPRSDAATGTTMSLIPQPGPSDSIQKNTGDLVPIDLVLDPGIHEVGLIRVQVKYDSTKLEPVQDNAFTPISSLAPPLQGPFVKDGTVSFILTSGIDPNKVINKVTTVGTFHFKAIEGTNDTPTVVTFTDNTQAFSLSTGTEISENVLSTANPAQITIIGESSNQIPDATATPTNTPTPTTTPKPSQDQSNTSTQSGALTLSFAIFLHSIGNSGDNVSPSLHSLSNKAPKQQSRPFTISLYNADTTQLVASQTSNFVYNNGQGNFTGVISLDDALPEGDYLIKVKTHNFLQRKVPGFIHLGPGIHKTLPSITLIAGDTNGDNKTDILDYNLLASCYSDFLPSEDCNDNKKAQTDLNDDDQVNQIDINLFLREIAVQNGD